MRHPRHPGTAGSKRHIDDHDLHLCIYAPQRDSLAVRFLMNTLWNVGRKPTPPRGTRQKPPVVIGCRRSLRRPSRLGDPAIWGKAPSRNAHVCHHAIKGIFVLKGTPRTDYVPDAQFIQCLVAAKPFCFPLPRSHFSIIRIMESSPLNFPRRVVPSLTFSEICGKILEKY